MRLGKQMLVNGCQLASRGCSSRSSRSHLQGRNGHQGRLSTKSQSLSCKQIVFDVQETNPFPLTFDLVRPRRPQPFHHTRRVVLECLSRLGWGHSYHPFAPLRR